MKSGSCFLLLMDTIHFLINKLFNKEIYYNISANFYISALNKIYIEYIEMSG